MRDLLKLAAVLDMRGHYSEADDIFARFASFVKIAAEFEVKEIKPGLWWADVSYANKDVAKNAGFRWNPNITHPTTHRMGIWATNDPNIVARLQPPWIIVDVVPQVRATQQPGVKTIIEQSANDIGVTIEFIEATREYVLTGPGTFKINQMIKEDGGRGLGQLGLQFRDTPKKGWYTSDESVAMAFITQESVNKLLGGEQERKLQTYQQSSATSTTRKLVSPLGRSYFPFQEAGIAFAIEHTAALIADEQGLGKSIEAIGLINNDPSINSVLIVCPATIKINWQRELEKWLVRPMTIGIAKGTKGPIPNTQIVIINYDILRHYVNVDGTGELQQRTWDLIVGDETHKVKDPDALRTMAFIGKMGPQVDTMGKPITYVDSEYANTRSCNKNLENSST